MRKKIAHIFCLMLCVVLAACGSSSGSSSSTVYPVQPSPAAAIEEEEVIVKPATVAAQPEDFWNEVFTVPAEDDVQAYLNPNGGRGPYIYGWTSLGSDARFTEYAVDFKADYVPDGTYFCLAQWGFDLSSLNKEYSNARNESANVSAYAGFQSLANGERVAIMSIWDMYAEDAQGVTHTFSAEQIYPEVEENTLFGNEGTGVKCIVPYDWQAGHWYRMLIQCATSDKGTTTIEQWVCDLETGEWTKLSAYDTGLTDSCMTGPTAVFNENFRPESAGAARALELRNIRVNDQASGQWQNVEGMYLGCEMGGEMFGYHGSYAFGALEDRFYLIAASALEDEIANGTGQAAGNFTVTNPESGQPY